MNPQLDKLPKSSPLSSVRVASPGPAMDDDALIELGQWLERRSEQQPLDGDTVDSLLEPTPPLPQGAAERLEDLLAGRPVGRRSWLRTFVTHGLAAAAAAVLVARFAAPDSSEEEQWRTIVYDVDLTDSEIIHLGEDGETPKYRRDGQFGFELRPSFDNELEPEVYLRIGRPGDDGDAELGRRFTFEELTQKGSRKVLRYEGRTSDILGIEEPGTWELTFKVGPTGACPSTDACQTLVTKEIELLEDSP